MRARSLDPTRSQRSPARFWRWGFIALATVSIALYLLNLALWDVHPSSPLGLSYGIAATVMMVGAALFGVRRRSMRLASRHRLGGSRAWLDFHLYGGAFFLLLMLMHSAFRLPVGALNVWLWVLGIWTAASGLVGLALQKWIPRVLASSLSLEVNYDRIPELCEEIRDRAAALAETCDDSVRALYRKKLLPALAAPRRSILYFLDPTGGIQARLAPFRYLEDRLPSDERAKLEQLERLFRAKLEIDAHYTLQRALRGWLLLHAPLSLLLIALVALHIFTVLYY